MRILNKEKKKMIPELYEVKKNYIFKQIRPIEIQTKYLAWIYKPPVYYVYRFNTSSIFDNKRHQYTFKIKSGFLDPKKIMQAFCAIYTHSADVKLAQSLLMISFKINKELKELLDIPYFVYTNYDAYMVNEDHVVFHEICIRNEFFIFNNSSYLDNLSSYVDREFLKSLIKVPTSPDYLGKDITGKIVKFE